MYSYINYSMYYQLDNLNENLNFSMVPIKIE